MWARPFVNWKRAFSENSLDDLNQSANGSSVFAKEKCVIHVEGLYHVLHFRLRG